MNPQSQTSPPDPLDTLLQQHFGTSSGDLTPSSGFTLSVIDAVHQRIAEPAPIPFPWRRVLPGAIATLSILIAVIVYALLGTSSRHIAFAPAPSSISPFHLTHSLLALTPAETAIAWVALALCLSLSALAASFRLAGSR